MKTNIKAGALIAAASALAIAVPAAAHPGPSSHASSGSHGSGTSHPSSSSRPGHNGHPSQSHKCRAHNRAYVEGGTVNAATTLTQAGSGDGTWSGNLVVDVTMANHAARADKQQTVTYTFTDAKLKVRFKHGASGFTAGERIKLIGKQAAVAKKCTALSADPAPVFRMLVVQPAAA